MQPNESIGLALDIDETVSRALEEAITRADAPERAETLKRLNIAGARAASAKVRLSVLSRHEFPREGGLVEFEVEAEGDLILTMEDDGTDDPLTGGSETDGADDEYGCHFETLVHVYARDGAIKDVEIGEWKIVD